MMDRIDEIVEMSETEAAISDPNTLPADNEERLAGTNGLGLHYREWLPKGAHTGKQATGGRAEVAGTVLLVHGFGEHLGRYGRLARQLNHCGYRVGGVDHQGMGKSEGARMYIDDYATYVDGMMAGHARLREGIDPTLPAFIFGHSMGGLVVFLHAIRHRDQANLFTGTVLSGPLMGIAVPVPAWQVAVGNFLAKCAPRFHFPLTMRPDLMTHDEEDKRVRIQDPLIPSFTTPGWYDASVRAMDLAKAEAHKVNWPTLWIIGGADEVCSPVASRAVFDSLTVPEHTVEETPELIRRHARSRHHLSASQYGRHSLPYHHWYEYPGLFHEVHNERHADRQRALRHLVHWLNSVRS